MLVTLKNTTKRLWPHSFTHIHTNKNFMVLWAGDLISSLGDQIYGIALTWYVLQTTGSTLKTGAVPAFAFIAQLVVGLTAGALVDRWTKKYTMICTDIVRGVLVLIGGVLAIRGSLPLWYIYFMSFFLTATGMFFSTASGAVMPEITGREHLLQANAFLSLTRRFVGLTGKSVSGSIIAIIGTPGAMIVNGLSFFISAMYISRARIPDIENSSTRDPISIRTIIKEVKQGLQFVQKHGILGPLLATALCANFGGGLVMGLTPVLVQKQLGMGVSILGILTAALLLGGLLGTSMMTGWGNKLPLGTCITISLILSGLLSILIGWAFWWPFTAILFAANGFALAIGNAPIQTVLQLQTPQAMRGRVFTSFIVLVNLGSPLAIAIGAFLADTWGLQLVYSVAGVSVTLCGLWGWAKFASISASREQEDSIN